jgi:ribonuclease G
LKREILMNTTARETRVAILEDDVLVELMVDRPDAARMVGDIYKGRVEAVLPGIQAAFVDIGTEKAAFLHVSDVAVDEEDDDEEPGAAPPAAEDEEAANGGGGGGGRGRRALPPIQDIVKKGQELLVQVSKEPISTKGPRVTAHISLPGRFVVYMPGSDHVGVSRKIEDREERTRLRAMARESLPPKSGGVIVRTVGEELTRETFERELKSLIGLWKQMQKKAAKSRAPAVVHREAKLVAGIIRDLFSQKVDSLIVDSQQVFDDVRVYLEQVDPSLIERVKLYTDPKPLFDAYDIESEIRDAFQRRVNLPSGGYIIVEPTEALVSIDVNTGRYTGKKDPEKTIFKTNVDAAREIARQVRLRDVGGIIVCDFIDMETKANREKVLQELRQHLSRDRARTKAFQVSELGLIEMTRQRVRASLYHTQTDTCPTCAGTGRIFTPETVIRRVERAIRRAWAEGKEKNLILRVHPVVALYVLEEEPGWLKSMDKSLGMKVALRDNPLLPQDDFKLVSAVSHQDISAKFSLG